MTATLGDICEAIVDCEHKTAPAGDGYALSVGTPAMKSGRLVVEACKPVSKSTYEHWTRRMRPGPGDLILAREAPVGQVVRVPDDLLVCLGQRTVLIKPDAAQVHPRFLHYWLLGPDAQETMAAQAAGATVPHLNVENVRKLAVSRLPKDPRLQAFAASILAGLDDLIENNRRRIELLEKMAQAIYREWFVRFRYPGHEDAMLIDSPLGLIPESWEVTRVAEMCERIQAGGTPRRSESSFWDEPEVDWYKTGDLTDSVLIHSSEQISRHAVEASTARTFEPGTILMAIYGSPTVGRLGLIESGSSANQAALGLVADSERTTTEHLWFVLRELREHLNQLAQGAAQQNVSKQKVENAPTILPPVELVQAFTGAAGPPWRLSHLLRRQAAALAAIRDLLLPKLVTGQIDVSELDLDTLVEPVG